MEIIILAGGLGTRLRSIVKNVPKPMAPIKNKPFLYYLLKYWIKNGATKIILSTGYKSEIIEKYFEVNKFDIPIIFSVENKPLGTGGGFLKALRFLDADKNFFVINGDTFFEVKLSNILNFHNNNMSDITIALFKSTDLERYKCFEIDANSRIKNSNQKINIEGYVNGGVYLFNNKLLKYIKKLKFETYPFSLEEFYIESFIKDKKRIFGMKFNKPFIDIGLPIDYLRAEKFFKNLKV